MLFNVCFLIYNVNVILAKPVGAYRPPGSRGHGEQIERKSLESLSSRFKASRTHVPGSTPNGFKNSTNGNGFNNGNYRKKKNEVEFNAPIVPVEPPSTVGSLGKDPEKRIKALKKKLKQIEELKMKIAQGETVEVNQLKKLETESDILNELKELTLS